MPTAPSIYLPLSHFRAFAGTFQQSLLWGMACGAHAVLTGLKGPLSTPTLTTRTAWPAMSATLVSPSAGPHGQWSLLWLLSFCLAQGYQLWGRPVNKVHFWFGHALRALMTCTFNDILISMCFCTFWHGNVLCTTTACTFSTF